MTGLDHAIIGLQQALDRPRQHPMWRWLVRHRLSGVHEVLLRESTRGGDAWLAPREDALGRERQMLVDRLGTLERRVLDRPDVEGLRLELKRLVGDLEHHHQRLNDLVYDTVSLELGGSD